MRHLALLGASLLVACAIASCSALQPRPTDGVRGGGTAAASTGATAAPSTECAAAKAMLDRAATGEGSVRD